MAKDPSKIVTTTDSEGLEMTHWECLPCHDQNQPHHDPYFAQSGLKAHRAKRDHRFVAAAGHRGIL